MTAQIAHMDDHRSDSLLPVGRFPIGSIDAYVRAVRRFPMLTLQEECELGRRLRENNDLDAAQKLITSHLRLVVAEARDYMAYGLPQNELIQEGNIGLMKAVKRFDERRGTRLVTYATHWINYEMTEYILRNWRMVKVATTKSHRKLFFNLRRHKTGVAALSRTQVLQLSESLDVPVADVIEMDKRMYGGDVSFDKAMDITEGEQYAPSDLLHSPGSEPTEVLEQNGTYRLHTAGIEHALSKLDARSRAIVEARWLTDDKGATLSDLAEQYNVSPERIRQIEKAAIKKMRGFLNAFV